jgi:hypothetical protein
MTRNGSLYSRHMPQADDELAEEVAEPLSHHVEPDERTPTRRLLDRIAAIEQIDTSWGDTYFEEKQAEISAQGDETSDDAQAGSLEV